MTTEEFFKLRRDLTAIRDGIKELCAAIQEHSKTIRAAQEAQQQTGKGRNPVPVIVSYDDQTVSDSKNENDRQYRTQKSIKNWTAAAVIAASVYAGIAAWQGYLSRRQLRVSEHIFEASERAYVGTASIGLTYVWQERGEVRTSALWNPKVTGATVGAVVKNFGPVPANHFDAVWKVTIGGVAMPAKRIPVTTSILFPTDTVSLGGRLDSSQIKSMIADHQTLAVQITISYDTPERYDQECREWQYVPYIPGFVDIGSCH